MTTRLDDMLNTIRQTFEIPIGFNTAGTADEEPVWRAPIACRVTAIRFLCEDAITGHATNYATLSLVNKELDGAGTDEIASFAFDTPSDDDVAAFDEAPLTLNGTPANLLLAAGEVVTLKKAVAASGMVISGSIILEATPDTT